MEIWIHRNLEWKDEEMRRIGKHFFLAGLGYFSKFW